MEWLRFLPARLGVAGALVVAIALNVGWLAYAAGTIRDRSTDRFRREAVAYIRAHPGEKFFVSPTVREWLKPHGLDSLANVTATADGSDVVFFSLYSESFEDESDWPANHRDLLVTWFGPFEVNLNYYPSWVGDDRIIAMTTARARAIRVAAVTGVTYPVHPSSLPWRR